MPETPITDDMLAEWEREAVGTPGYYHFAALLADRKRLVAENAALVAFEDRLHVRFDSAIAENERLRAGLEVIESADFPTVHLIYKARALLANADLRDPAVRAAVAAGTWEKPKETTIVDQFEGLMSPRHG